MGLKCFFTGHKYAAWDKDPLGAACDWKRTCTEVNCTGTESFVRHNFGSEVVTLEDRNTNLQSPEPDILAQTTKAMSCVPSDFQINSRIVRYSDFRKCTVCHEPVCIPGGGSRPGLMALPS
jgi:hypothetical protein